MEEKAHVLIQPFPYWGHVKPMLTLAKLLSHGGLHVTFLNTHHIHHRLPHLHSLSTQFPTLHLDFISDGLPSDHPRTLHHLQDLISSLDSKTKPLFKELLISFRTRKDSGRRPPVTCIISDGILSFPIDVAEELAVPIIAFRTFSAYCLWSYFCLPSLIREGSIPFADDNLDEIVDGIPGMDGILRRRDLPSICRLKIDHPMFQYFVEVTQTMTRASGLILNTFDDLEPTVLPHIAALFSRIYTVGPINALAKSRIGEDISVDFIEKDETCIEWLDSQPLCSVVYVSLGSLVSMTPTQMVEIWHGLINSGNPFLWVLRSDSIAGEEEDEILKELKLNTRDKRGLFVEWAPQEEVLSHRSVGGFITHCGWNSTMESIVAGVPMLCWPHIADQQINSRCVAAVWRVGLDMKDTCDRSTVENMVRSLMDGQRDEIGAAMKKLQQSSENCVLPGGSSYLNLEMLINEIKKLM